MFLSELAIEMAEDLRIEDDDIQAFIHALEDGGEQLGNLGYTQEDIEKVHDELWTIK